MLPAGWEEGLSEAQVQAVLDFEARAWWDLLPIGEHHKGYLRVRIPPFHPYGTKAGCQYLHRLVMMEHLGRRLSKWEHVHHKHDAQGRPAPRDTTDPRDLEILEEADHGRYHYGKRICCGPHVHVCPECRGGGCGSCQRSGVYAA